MARTPGRHTHPMDTQLHSQHNWFSQPTLYPKRVKWLRRMDAVAQVIGMGGVIVGHGIRRTGILPWEFGLIVFLAMASIAGAIAVRFRWSLAKISFFHRHLWTVLAGAIWAVGIVGATILAPVLPDINGPLPGGSRWWGYVQLSEVVLVLYSLTGLIRGLRRAAAGGINPAFLLVCSFLIMIGIGTVVLMLPICRHISPPAPLESAPLLTALFTATSAACVTGLIVVDTGTYWSLQGQIVILILFQIGGLGIMTFGAFFAAIAGRNVQLTEFATLKELLSSEGLGDLRRLAFAIAGFTLAAELIGAILLMPLWADRPLPERFFMSVFHSVSAFCNAGFALTADSFVGMGSDWHVWGVVCGLIIIGGIGFATLYNLGQVARQSFRVLCFWRSLNLPHSRSRLTLTTNLVVVSTLGLLIGGMLGLFFLERAAPPESNPRIGLADAWFQSVTFRTAGFNTVDLGQLQPASKLLAVFLMVIGASPGSTGGGVKTIVFAVAAVGLLSVLRGRERVEAFGRTIPAQTMNRALAIFFVFLSTTMITTILLVIFERRPEIFLDHLFEAASAVGTVGVSTTITNPDGIVTSTTQSLSTTSRCVIIVAMFLGRVGPLTILLALAGNTSSARYEYPVEPVTLG